MKTTLLYNAIVVTPAEVIEHCAVAISKGTITYIGAVENSPCDCDLRLDIQGKFLAPGFIDMHVHGGKGVSFENSSLIGEDIQTYSEWVVTTGVTNYLCSIAAKDAQSLVEKIKQYVNVLENGLKDAQPIGLHLEGPFMSKKRKGAFNPDWLRLPDIEEAKSYIRTGKGWIRQITIAPELPGAQEIAAYFHSEGVIVALGHTDSDYDLAAASLSEHFTHVTHTFNAQSGFHHRQPGVVGAVLASDNITAELIADGVHAHPGAMKILVRCLGSDRIVLITDAMPGAGLPDGKYNLVGLEVTVKDGYANLPDGTIAGSTALLNQCVRNINQMVGVPFRDAIKMASLNPARALGLSDHLGSIAVGKDANLVVLDGDANVYLTVVRGEIAYNQL
ncbi:MAG: N-acetylglucosamine-6-phosphate deacetylase [Anaerolineales bacterium]|nr:N-acetylglucosamine-6-phosphate deacetylase [Anaerolineales bacterium]